MAEQASTKDDMNESEVSGSDLRNQGVQLPQKVSFIADEIQGQVVKFSPLSANRIAASFSNEFGHEGEGFAYILERNDLTGELECLFKISCRDNIFDVTWSDKDPNLFATAGGDGFVHIFNIGNKYPKVPTSEFKGHKKEMSSVDWNTSKFSDLILAACWDGTVSTYDITSQWPITKMAVSDLSVYQACWSPHSAKTFISVSSDGVLQLWDMNVNPPKASIYVSVSDEELLCCDWSLYFPWLVATSGSDSVVKGWDIRNYSAPLFINEDHGGAIRRIKFSPWHQTLIASASYDYTIRLFDYQASSSSLDVVGYHTEHVYGVDWNVHKKNEIVSCGWDSTVNLFTPDCLKDS